jgi:hypothetical protein
MTNKLPTRIWKAGERCQLRSGTARTIAEIKVAAPDGTSLAVSFEAWRTDAGVHQGGMALHWDPERGMHESLHSGEVIELLEPPPRLREVSKVDVGATLRGVLLFRPEAHPIWHTYVVTLAHLRVVAGMQEPHLQYPDATHEIAIMALSPDSEPDPELKEPLRTLFPANLIHQLRGRDDAFALALFDAFTKALAGGELSPDTDWTRHTVAWLGRWERAD